MKSLIAWAAKTTLLVSIPILPFAFVFGHPHAEESLLKQVAQICLLPMYLFGGKIVEVAGRSGAVSNMLFILLELGWICFVVVIVRFIYLLITGKRLNGIGA
ncbi:MAG: hypothetical protein ABL970_11320 [Nitrospira sp.]